MVDQCGSYDFTPLKLVFVCEHSHIYLSEFIFSHRPTLLWRLDMREDSHRRRMKLLPNPNGSMHTEAVRSVGEEMSEEQRKR